MNPRRRNEQRCLDDKAGKLLLRTTMLQMAGWVAARSFSVTSTELKSGSAEAEPKVRREDENGLCSSLEKLPYLQELDVAAIEKDEVIDMDHSPSPSSLQSLRGLILRGRLESLPPCMKQLYSLKKIELLWSRLSTDNDPLVPLQHLRNLNHVWFTQAYEGEGFQFKAGGFMKLETLNLRNITGLKRVMIEEGSMPHLRRLYLPELPLLEELPLGIEHLREVQSLRLI